MIDHEIVGSGTGLAIIGFEVMRARSVLELAIQARVNSRSVLSEAGAFHERRGCVEQAS